MLRTKCSKFFCACAVHLDRPGFSTLPKKIPPRTQSPKRKQAFISVGFPPIHSANHNNKSFLVQKILLLRLMVVKMLLPFVLSQIVAAQSWFTQFARTGY